MRRRERRKDSRVLLVALTRRVEGFLNNQTGFDYLEVAGESLDLSLFGSVMLAFPKSDKNVTAFICFHNVDVLPHVPTANS